MHTRCNILCEIAIIYSLFFYVDVYYTFGCSKSNIYTQRLCALLLRSRLSLNLFVPQSSASPKRFHCSPRSGRNATLWQNNVSRLWPFFLNISLENQPYFWMNKNINSTDKQNRWSAVIPLNNQRLKRLEKKDTVMLYE